MTPAAAAPQVRPYTSAESRGQARMARYPIRAAGAHTGDGVRLGGSRYLAVAEGCWISVIVAVPDTGWPSCMVITSPGVRWRQFAGVSGASLMGPRPRPPGLISGADSTQILATCRSVACCGLGLLMGPHRPQLSGPGDRRAASAVVRGDELQVCSDDAVAGLSSAPLVPSRVAPERHLLSGLCEKVPELDGLPLDSVEVRQDAEGDLPLVLAKVVADVIRGEASVASSAGRGKICCAAKQLGNVHGHILDVIVIASAKCISGPAMSAG